jgi:hypothetical protein
MTSARDTDLLVRVLEVEQGPFRDFYRVAAIFPEHFQSFTVTLKKYFFVQFFCPKPSQLCDEA